MYQLAPTPPVYTAASCFSFFLPTSCSFAGISIPARHSTVVFIMLQLRISMPSTQNTTFYSDTYAIWARYARMDITCDQLEPQSFAKVQFFTKQLYCSDKERVHFGKIHCVQSSFVAVQQGVFWILVLLLCGYFGVEKVSNAYFVDAFARWLFLTQPLLSNPAIVNLDDLWRDLVLTTLMTFWYKIISMSM